ncbi:patatin-like phospholipase family protein [Aquincola sp. S2]|uniref:Patatin-like phospholipase family protein n=1 Tax=Pseudaquabacterium terrae TaxID=2732868 RepID=A0ABX2EU98_9BURK|nr:patatin-like phospholipase family protein [Aquabacterium terrae]NRF72226.1 patatin-like phospholipase family protein [Aquabacterium terrae]
MAVEVSGSSHRIGLALSGGGFRAAAFHLGVMQALHRLRLLDKIDLLSCVSGGSIAGATLALHWSDGQALQQLDTYLRTTSIAVASAIGGILDPFESRLDKLAHSYDRDLFGGQALAALSAGPRIYLNATNLATGNMFFFVAGGSKPTEMGDHEMGVCAADGIAISRAVAASSAFPPVFAPLKLGPELYPHAAPIDYVTLTDGGIYDNMGVNPALRTDRNPLDYLIISDGGKPFANQSEPTGKGSVVLVAALDIMMEQIRGLEFDRVQHRHLAGKGPKPLWFSIDSEIGEERPGDAVFASSIGTNLKALRGQEMDVLTRHGGALVTSRLAKYAPELIA